MAAAVVTLGAIAALVFLPGLTAGFVSDAWLFLERADRYSLDQVAAFVDANRAGFLRPAIELYFWVGYRLLGLDPLPYHLVGVVAHASSAALLGVLTARLTGHGWGALAAAATLLFAVAAHEPIFDVSDIHNALAGPLLIGAVLAFARGSFLSALLTVVLATVDESVLLVLPLVTVYAVVAEPRPLRSVLPVAAVSALYVSFRLIGGGFGSESDGCRALGCLAAGLADYSDRPLVRPDGLIRADPPTLVVIGVTLGIVLLVRPWKRWRVVAFGAAWTFGSSIFFILGLYPYVADRFLYVPSMGLAIVTGALFAEAAEKRGALRRSAATVAVSLVVAWIGVGAVVLHDRGERWTAAGRRAEAIVEGIYRLHPEPSLGTVFVIEGVPLSDEPQFPPGNTGPYVFHNGLHAALWLRFDRRDLSVVEPPGVPPYGDPMIHLTIRGSSVSRSAW